MDTASGPKLFERSLLSLLGPKLNYSLFCSEMDTANFTFQVVGRTIAILYFKTETVAETTFRASWFWSTSARFPGTCEIFSSPGDSKLTRAGLGLQWNGNRKSFWTHTFELLDRNRTPLHLKTERVAETALRASWFWATSARFAGTKGIYSSSEDSKLIPDGLGLQ